MTYAQEVAREQIALRLSDGWSWEDIAAEADACCVAVRAPVVTSLCPHQVAPYWAVERAYALAWEALRHGVFAALC